MTQSDASPQQQQDSAAGEEFILNSPEEANAPKDFLLWAAVIVIATLTAYSPALHGRFLWDDDRHVVNNRDLRDANGLVNIWTGHWHYLFAGAAERPRVRFYTPQYYPLTHTTYWFEYQLSGAKQDDINTTIFHVTNIVLHAASAILLWFILRELAVPGAWVAAMIFALHPIEVESVAWISERKNVLAGAFFFGSILAYLRSSFGPKHYGDEDHLPLYIVSLALFLAAVLSKTVACSAPAVMLLLVWWKRGKLAGRDFLATAPMFIVGIVLGWFTSWIERNYVRAPDLDLSIVQRLLIAANAIWFYACKLLWPTRLTFIYPQWDLKNPLLWAGLIGLLAALAILVALRKRLNRGVIVAILSFLGVLVPALGFFDVYPMRYSYVADHFQYLASPALIALLVATVAVALRKLRVSTKATPYAAAGVVLIVLLVLTIRQASVYASPVDLWRDTASKNPNSAMVRNNYGASLFFEAQEGDRPPDEILKMLDQSAEQLRRAVELKPDHEKAWTTWGQILLLKQKPDEALEKFDRALAINPKNVDALLGRGQALVDLKKLDEALTAYQLAETAAREQHQPRTVGANILGAQARVLAAKGDRAAAATRYQDAIRAVGERADLHLEYGHLLRDMGKKPEAAKEYAIAITLDPAYIDARIALARLMIDVKNLPGAQQQLIAAARINATYGPLMDAAKEFDAAMSVYEASTRPSTTRAATTRPTITPATSRS